MCYCYENEAEILSDIVFDIVPDDALVNSCCWRRICRVRGLHFNQVDADLWRGLCTRRGYLYGRQNSRGC
jgi:hypothetical protein